MTSQAYELTRPFYLLPQDAIKERENRYAIARSRQLASLPQAERIGRLVTAYLPFHNNVAATDEALIKKLEIDSSSHELEIARRIFQIIPDLPTPPYLPVSISEIKHISIEPNGYIGRLGLDNILKMLQQERVIRRASGRYRYQLVRGVGESYGSR